MNLLLLAGTAEARELAGLLADDDRFNVIASLAGATREAKPLPVATRSGGFDCADIQVKYIQENGIEAVVDATHPFAVQISTRTQAICEQLGLPYLQLLRPGWQPGPEDNWIFVNQPDEVAALLPSEVRIFLATGRNALTGFVNLSGRPVFCRVVDEPEAPFPFPGGEYVIGRPPFLLECEITLFRRLGITHLVVKDAGGVAEAKLAAARELGITVVVLRRPTQPPGEKAACVGEAMAWLERLL